jgi:L-proline amide hydrolase
VLGQSWGGMLAQEHAITPPPGLRSVILSNTAASFAGFAAEANALRAALPPEVEATLQRHEAAGTTDDPEYAAACDAFYRRHLCRADPWPEEVNRSFAAIDSDPTVYHTTNGPSEFHIVGSFKDWSALDRLGRIDVPVLVISGGTTRPRQSCSRNWQAPSPGPSRSSSKAPRTCRSGRSGTRTWRRSAGSCAIMTNGANTVYR